MPIYDYECEKCKKRKEVTQTISEMSKGEGVVCECGNKMTHIITGCGKPIIFPVGYWDNFGPEPIFISSKKQLIEECRSRGVYCKGIDERNW